MKKILVILFLTGIACFAAQDKSTIPVTVQAQAGRALFQAGQPNPMILTITNGLSQPIRFTTFATKPNEWNGETMNVSLVDIYRAGVKEKRNLYLANPEIKVPLTVSGPSSHEIAPSGSLSITIDISKWKIQGGWLKGGYELVFRMDCISVDDKITLSVLSEPFHVLIQ